MYPAIRSAGNRDVLPPGHPGQASDHVPAHPGAGTLEKGVEYFDAPPYPYEFDN